VAHVDDAGLRPERLGDEVGIDHIRACVDHRGPSASSLLS
jgi:hypothetical protein